MFDRFEKQPIFRIPLGSWFQATLGSSNNYIPYLDVKW